MGVDSARKWTSCVEVVRLKTGMQNSNADNDNNVDDDDKDDDGDDNCDGGELFM